MNKNIPYKIRKARKLRLLHKIVLTFFLKKIATRIVVCTVHGVTEGERVTSSTRVNGS